MPILAVNFLLRYPLRAAYCTYTGDPSAYYACLDQVRSIGVAAMLLLIALYFFVALLRR